MQLWGENSSEDINSGFTNLSNLSLVAGLAHPIMSY